MFCKDCRYWTVEHEEMEDKKQCDLLNDSLEKERVPEDAGVLVVYSVVFTGPQFGCIHWKEK